jgi:hypothetical protein
MQSFRNILRWIFLVLGLLYIAWSAPDIIHNFRQWRGALPGDPVAAGFWRSAFYAGATDILIVLVIGIVTWLVLKPRKRARASSALV